MASKKHIKKSQDGQMESNTGRMTSTPMPVPSTDTNMASEVSPMALRTRDNGGKEVEIRQDKASNCLTGVQTDAMIIKTPKKTLENREEQSTKGTYKQLTLPISLPPTLSLLDGLAKTIACLENEQDKEKVREVVFSLRQLEFSGLKNPSISLLKTSPDYSALMMVVTSTQQLECSPTLGMTVNGKFLIQGGFSPRIESGLSLSDILLETVDHKYFLSEKHQQTILDRYKRANNTDIDFDSENKIISDSGTGRTLQQVDSMPSIRVGGDVSWLIESKKKSVQRRAG